MVLITIALWTSPFRTFDVNRALLRSFCIDTIIVSPRIAKRLLKPFKTLFYEKNQHDDNYIFGFINAGQGAEIQGTDDVITNGIIISRNVPG